MEYLKSLFSRKVGPPSDEQCDFCVMFESDICLFHCDERGCVEGNDLWKCRNRMVTEEDIVFTHMGNE